MRAMRTKEAIKVVECAFGMKAVSRAHLAKGTVIHRFSAPVLRGPNVHSVQFAEDVHVEPFDGAQFLNHSCADYNAKIAFANDTQVSLLFQSLSRYVSILCILRK